VKAKTIGKTISPATEHAANSANANNPPRKMELGLLAQRHTRLQLGGGSGLGLSIRIGHLQNPNAD
jgi:hypothetical protein